MSHMKHLFLYSVFSLSVLVQPVFGSSLSSTLRTCLSNFRTPDSKPSSLLEELSQPGLNIKSVLFVPDRVTPVNFGRWFWSPNNVSYPGPLTELQPFPKTGVTYSIFTLPLKKKGKGFIVLSFQAAGGYSHKIYWESSLTQQPLDFDKTVAEKVFNELYERVYGEGAEKMADLLLTALMNPILLNDIERVMNLKSLFFDKSEEDFRVFVLSAFQNLAAQSKTAEKSEESNGGPRPPSMVLKSLFF